MAFRFVIKVSKMESVRGWVTKSRTWELNQFRVTQESVDLWTKESPTFPTGYRTLELSAELKKHSIFFPSLGTIDRTKSGLRSLSRCRGSST